MPYFGLVAVLTMPDHLDGPEDRLAALEAWAGESGLTDLQHCVIPRLKDATTYMTLYEAWAAELPELSGEARANVEIRMDVALIKSRQREEEVWEVCIEDAAERSLWAIRDDQLAARSLPEAPCAVQQVERLDELEASAASAFESLGELWGTELARVEFQRIELARQGAHRALESARACVDPDYKGTTRIEVDAPEGAP